MMIEPVGVPATQADGEEVFKLSVDDVAGLLRMVEASDIALFRLKTAHIDLLLARDGATIPMEELAQAPAQAQLPPQSAPQADRPVARHQPPRVGMGAGGTTGSPGSTRAATTEGLVAIEAPLLGTFYAASEPGAAPYVEVGAHVEPDTTVGLIEAMKMFTAVRAGTGGIVRRIDVEDKALVQYESPLMWVDPELDE